MSTNKTQSPLDAFKSSALDLAGLKSAANQAGLAAAAGNDSILEVGIKVYQSAAYKGLAPGDVKEVYTSYAEGANASKFGAKIDLKNLKALKSAVSKLGVFHKLASVPGKKDKIALVTRTIQVANSVLAAQGKAKGGTHYERVLKVLRATVKLGDKPPMKDDEIETLLFPVAPDRSLLDKMEAMLATATKLVEDENYASVSEFPAQIMSGIQAVITRYKAHLENLGRGDDSDENEDDGEFERDNGNAPDSATTEKLQDEAANVLIALQDMRKAAWATYPAPVARG